MDETLHQRLFQKLRETGTVDRRVGSGRPRFARTEENIDLVDDLIVSQEDKPVFITTSTASCPTALI